jgi:hypothetical protein
LCYLGALLITKGETAAGTPVRSVVDGRVAAQAEGGVPLFRAADDRLFAEDDVARFQIPRCHHVPGQDQANNIHLSSNNGLLIEMMWDTFFSSPFRNGKLINQKSETAAALRCT